MADDYKRWIGQIFDGAASRYGTGGSTYFDFFAEGLVRRARLQKDWSVLDVATGRGAILRRLVGKVAHVEGIDLSPEMVALTGKEFGVPVSVMDAEKLQFPDHSFDAIFCGFAVFFFPNPMEAMKEFLRVLKPGGKAYFSTFAGPSRCQALAMQGFARFGLQLVAKTPFSTEEAILSLMTGFENVQIVSDELHHVYPDFETWFQSLWTHGTRGNLEKLSESQRAELKEGLRNASMSDLMRVFYIETNAPLLKP